MKKLFAGLLTLCMVMAMLPVQLRAEEAAPLASHDSEKHICEHCVASGAADTTPTWTAWGDDEAEKTKLPTTAGHYYLTTDLEVKKVDITAGHVVLCLNGKTVTAVGTEKTADDRFYYPRNDGSLTIVDCTAHTETVEGKQVYKAGKLTGATAAAIMFHNATTTTGSVNIYDGIITGNSRAGSGGAFCVQGKGTLNIYGGQITDNHATNGTGGAIYLNSSSNTLYVENALIANNSASSYSGAIQSNNAAVTIKDSEISGNSGSDAGAITMKGAALTLENAKIINNRTTKGAYGAIHPYNSGGTATVNVKGETVIDNNIYGAADSTVERNLYLRNHWYTVVPSGLTGNAMIGLTLEAARMNDTTGKQYITGALADTSCGKYFSSDNAAYVIGFTADNRMILKDKPAEPDHPHKLCCDAACTEHEELDFKKWNDATSLPTAGNYSLQVDVQLTGTIYVSGKLNLCLNGHTVTAAKDSRLLSADKGGVLSITDCTGNGVITGGSKTYGGAIAVQQGGTFHFYGGKISGNTALTEEGGAVYVKGGNATTAQGGIFHMYGGEISGNTARQGAAVRLTNAAAGTQNAVFNMYGGKITGNQAKTNGSAIYAGTSTVNLYGGSISGNTAGTNGTIYIGTGGQLTITDARITGNTAGNGGGVYVASDKETLTLSGSPYILGNTAGGKANNVYLAGESIVTLGQLSDDAKVGISAAISGRGVSTETDTDYLKNFSSDSTYRTLTYQDKILYFAISTEHQHCLCAAAAQGCDHTNQVWQAWESNASLPTGTGCYYLLEDVVLASQANIAGDVKLCLNGHTVSMAEDAENVRVIKLQEKANLYLTDCQGSGKLTGGNAEYGGCVNINRGAAMYLYGGSITGNTSLSASGGQGAGVYVQATKDGVKAGEFYMYGGSITGNEAVWGAGVYGASTAKIDIYGGSISGNHASSYGGGIYATGAETNLYAATLESNTAGSGGAVYVTGANSQLNITGTTFTNNKITGYAGGAILAQSNGTQVNITGATFSGNEGQAGGALFASTNTTLNVEDSVFTGNTANQGAAIYTLRSTAKLEKVTLEKNTVTGKGTLYIAAGDVTLDNTTIKNNSGGSGTGITTASGTATVNGENTVFYPNVTMLSGSISGNTSAKGSGGAVLLQSKTVFTMKGGSISGNRAMWCGGVYASTNSTFNMQGGSISGNYTEKNGGGVHALRATLNLSGGTISGNTAKASGGGVYLSGSRLNLSGTAIVNNKAETGTGGGGICTTTAKANNVVYEPYILMTGGSVSNNQARHGGGILLQGSSKTIMEVRGGKICDNKASMPGGAVYASTKTTLKITGGTISGNKTEKNGGAVYHNNSNGVYENVEFAGNESFSSGGAFLITGANTMVTMKNVKITDSKGASGAGICHQGKAMLTMEGCQVTNCAGTGNGGGLYISNNTPAVINDTLFSGCSAVDAGGVWVGINSEVTLDAVTIQDNKASGNGGGLLTRDYLLTMKNSKITGNEATLTGGGISTYKFPLQGVSYVTGDRRVGTIIENTQVHNNKAGNQGGGAYFILGSRIFLTDVTFTGNQSAQEGGAFWASSDLTMDGVNANTNLSGGEGYAVWLDSANYDGHSYQANKVKMAGNMIVEKNEGGDLYLGKTTTIAVTEKGLGQDTLVSITIDSGVLTNRVFGAYHYEGGNRVYTITYGDRSMTDPEYDPTLAVKTEKPAPQQETRSNDTWLYVGIGAVVLVIAAIAIVLLKKKKTPQETGKE